MNPRRFEKESLLFVISHTPLRSVPFLPLCRKNLSHIVLLTDSYVITLNPGINMRKKRPLSPQVSGDKSLAVGTAPYLEDADRPSAVMTHSPQHSFAFSCFLLYLK